MDRAAPLYLDQLVADSVAFEFPDSSERDMRFHFLRGKAEVLIGMRRTGKSFLLYQHAKALLNDGIAREQIAFFNFDNLAFTGFDGNDLLALTEAWFKRFPHARAKRLTLLLDEIQQVASWERAVRELIETKNLQLMLTGSSAKLLSQEIATSLRGRSVSMEVWPFSLRESMELTGAEIPLAWPLARQKTTALRRSFETYFATGGFPEVLRLNHQDRKRVLSEYIDVTLMRDVVERHRVGNVLALKRFVAQLLRLSGRKISINKIASDFASQGIDVSKNTLYDFQAYLEDTFFFFSVPIFSDSPRKQQVNPKKGYAIDPALVRANTFASSDDNGQHLENLVYIELRRRGQAPHYLVTKTGKEVDFVVYRNDGSLELIQVAWSLADTETKARELRAFSSALEEYPNAHCTLVTAYESEDLRIGRKHVHIVPYFEWTLRA
jgi:uncharacterized protein